MTKQLYFPAPLLRRFHFLKTALIMLFVFSSMFSQAQITWTGRSANAIMNLSSVTYGNGLFVAVANSGTAQRVTTSPDGITWTSQSASENSNWMSVTYGNGLFVAVASAGTNYVMTSPDGLTWTSRVEAAKTSWRSVIYGNGLFVAVAASGKVMTSPDGISWTLSTTAPTNLWRNVTFGNGLFVAVGSNSVMTSPDGLNWTSRTPANDNAWSAVCYGIGKFVAVSTSGINNRVMTSPDGITWTSRTSAADNDWQSICFAAGMFVAVSSSGTDNRVMTSQDAINWTSRTSASDNVWFGVTFANGVFVAVSATATGNPIMTSLSEPLTPILNTLDIISVSENVASVSGNFVSLGFPDPTSHGVCWNTTGAPTIADYKVDKGSATTVGTYIADLSGLIGGTIYYVRTFATNLTGTIYGGEVVLTTTLAAPNISYASPPVYKTLTAIDPLLPTNNGGKLPANTPYDVTTFAGSEWGNVDGVGTAARFNSIKGVTTDNFGNLYVAGLGDIIKKIAPDGTVTSWAGSGIFGYLDADSNLAKFNNPTGVVVNNSNTVFVADNANNVIRKVSQGVVTTFAGSGTVGSTDGIGSLAKFNSPYGIAIDAAGTLYVSEEAGNKIRKITADGAVTTLAGSGVAGATDATGTAATFRAPSGIAVDPNGYIYVADRDNNKIRKISPAGVVTTFAGSGADGSNDGTGTTASFYHPTGVAIDKLGNIYVANTDYSNIRKITPDGVVTTLAGSYSFIKGSVDGIGTAALFDLPSALTVDALGNLIVADDHNYKIRKIALTGYTITPALPEGLTFNNVTGEISGTPILTAITPATDYTITAINGTGLSSTTLNIKVDAIAPHAPIVNTDLVTNISDVTATGNAEITFLGTDNPTAYGVCWNTTGSPTIEDAKVNSGATNSKGKFTFTMNGLLHLTTYYVRAYATNSVGTSYGEQVSFTTLDLLPNISYITPNYLLVNSAITPIQPTNSGGVLNSSLIATPFAGAGYYLQSIDGDATTAKFYNPRDIAFDAAGNLFVAELESNKIRKITPNGDVSTFAGSGAVGSADGTGIAATFNKPYGLAFDSFGNLFVCDYGNHKIRKITPAGVVTTFAGSGTPGNTNGTGIAASFKYPSDIAVDAQGNLFVSEFGNNQIRKITPAGVVTTFVVANFTNLFNDRFNYPNYLAFDAAGILYVSDYYNAKIRRISPSGEVTTFAGSGAVGSEDGIGIQASFGNAINGLAFDKLGNLYVSDAANYKIRKITPAGEVSTFAGTGVSGGTNGVPAIIKMSLPYGLAFDNSDNLYIAEGSRIRKIAPGNYYITPALPAGLNFDIFSGVISGTPTTISPAKNYTISAFNGTGTGTATISIAITEVLTAAPTVTTQAVTAIAPTTATGNGNITALGTANPTAYGVCWNSTGSPTTANSKTNKGAISVTGAFTANMTGLTAGTKYYVRAFATNSVNTSYGNEVTFTTLVPVSAPTVTTQAVTAIAPTTATGNGNITALGSANPTAYGVCWNTTGSPTTANSKTDKGAISATGAFMADMAGLTAGTKYYVRAFATNSVNTVYGNQVTFTTLSAPTVTTQAVTAIAITTATGNGNITALGSPNPTAYGVCWNTTGSPTTADSKTDKGAISATGAFMADIAGLTAGTKYYVRAFATNSVNTVYGNQLTFNTLVPVTAPTAQATKLLFSTTGTNPYNIVLRYNASASAQKYLVVRKSTSAPTFVPADGTEYAIGAQGADQIVYAGTDTTVTELNSTAGDYFYAIYAYNGSSITTKYLTTAPLVGNTYLSISNSQTLAASAGQTSAANFPAAGVSVNFDNGTTGTNLTVTKTNEAPVSNLSGLSGVKGLSNVYFTITSDNPTPGNYSIIIDFSSLGLTQTQWAKFKVLKRNNATTAWTDVTTIGGTIVNRQTDGVWGKITISGLSSFSEFVGLLEPTTFTVTSALEDVNVSGTLNFLIANASSGDIITFDVSAMGTNKIMLTRPVVVYKNISIIGAAGGVILDGSSSAMVIEINDALVVELENLTIQNGYNDYTGGIWNRGNLTITNCVISDNVGEIGGGGILQYNEGSNKNQVLTLVNCTITNNNLIVGDYFGAGGITVFSGVANIYNSIIQGNTGTNITDVSTSVLAKVYNSCIGNLSAITVTEGTGNIDTNPLFVGSTINATHPYSLYGNSPCVNTGSNTYSFNSKDIRNETRIQNTTIDMGAYEWTSGVDPNGLSTAIANGNEGKIQLYSVNQKIVVVGADDAQVAVYNHLGQQLFAGKTTNGMINKSFAKGIYIVKVNNEVQKVFVR